MAQVWEQARKSIKNRDSKKNGLVIGQSAKNLNFNYSMNFEITTDESDRTML